MSTQTRQEQRPVRLNKDQLAAYERDGYIVVEGLVPLDEIEALRARVREYTHEGRALDGIRMQVEPRIQRGEVKVEHPGDGVRKLDGLVEHDDVFRELGLNDNIVGVVEQILGPDLKLFRNTLLLKPPQVGSAKGMHQDSPYWPIEPMNLCSCWFALDDATAENGCMMVVPGWHRKGSFPHARVTDDFVMDEASYRGAETVMAPVKAGGGLFFHSLIPHATAPNRSNSWRRAIALSYMSAKSRFTGEGPGTDFPRLRDGETAQEPPVFFHVRGRTYPDCVR